MTFPVFIKAAHQTRISIAKEIKEVNRLRMRYERAMARSLYTAFARVGDAAAAEYQRQQTIDDAVRPLQRQLERIYRAHYEAVVNKFAGRVYENRKLTPFSNFVFQLYEREGAQRVVGVAETTRRRILRAIRTGEREGLGVDKTAKLIKEKTKGAIGRARAATIARTETHAAASYATHEATKELNLPAQRKRWVSVGDGRTRSHHAAANGQEVGIDEKFIIRFRGAEIEMNYPHDGSGGAANNINCRCLAVYYTDEDALFDSFDEPEDTPTGGSPLDDFLARINEPQPEPVEEVVEDVLADLPIGETFLSPFAAGVTNRTFKELARKTNRRDAWAATQERLSDAMTHKSYQIEGRVVFRSRSLADVGSWANDGLTDDAVIAVAAIMKELNYFADWLNIPRLRGIKPVTKDGVVGNMGDGILGLNARFVNNYVKDLEVQDLSELESEYRKLLAARAATQAKLREVQEKIENTTDPKRRDRLYKQRDKLREELLDDRAHQRIFNLEQQLGSRARLWYVGNDDTSISKPWTAEEYSAHGLQHLRSLMYHEFGHHIHQIYKKRLSLFDRPPPLERELKKFWRGFRKARRQAEVSTRYGETNEKEFFVESFALYMMGKKELVHPKALEIIERIFDERRG